MSEDSLKLILEVLEPKQSKDDLMEEDVEGSDSSEGSEASDSGDGSEASDSSEDGDSDSGGSVGGVDVGDPMFRAEVRKALGAAAMDSDAEVTT